jgi:hypothetical protein
MRNIPDKIDSSTTLLAEEYNDHKNELQSGVARSGQTLDVADTLQHSRAMCINGIAAQSFQDSGSDDTIQLTPVTGVSGFVVPETYAQLDGAIVEFYKSSENSSATVTIAIGQTTGELLTPNKPVKDFDGTDLTAGQLIGHIRAKYSLTDDEWRVVGIRNNSTATLVRGYNAYEIDATSTDIIVKSPVYEINGYIVSNTDQTLSITGLAADTWHAVTVDENTGTHAIATIASMWNPSGLSVNKLGMSSVYDTFKKYCVFGGKRVIYVFKTKGTTGILIGRKIPNRPLSEVIAYNSSPQSMDGTAVALPNLDVDINSEFDLGANAFVANSYRSNVEVAFSSPVTSFAVPAGSPATLLVRFNGLEELGATAINNDSSGPAVAYSLAMNGTFTFNSTDTLDVLKLENNAGGVNNQSRIRGTSLIIRERQ